MITVRMEAACFIVILFVTIIFQTTKRRYSRANVSFSRLLFVSMLYTLSEGAAVFALAHLEKIDRVHLMVIMELFLIFLFLVYYMAFLYIKAMVNEELPSLKQIGIGVNIFVISFLVLGCIIPVMNLTYDNGHMGIRPMAKYAYVAFILYELVIVYMMLRGWHSLNRKCRQIMTISVILQSLLYVVQLMIPKSIIVGITIMLMILSYYMTVENPDVDLIRQLQDEKEKADMANKAKTSFIANVSHEIRTPINAVLGMDEIILRDGKEDRVRQYAMDIRSAAQALHSIINDILDLSKMESGKMEIIPVDYHMKSLLNDTVNLILLKAADKKLDLRIEADPDIPCGLHGDDVRIRQVLTNLLSNAVKYTHEGSVTFTIKKEQQTDEAVTVSYQVTDTGIGMKEEDLARLYVAFERIDTVKNRNIEGTGLGMNITMQLLELMGSSLEVSSEYGKGTTFRFQLEQKITDFTPMGEFKKEQINLPEEYIYRSSFEAPDARLLVVDDNAVNRKVFMGLLEKTKIKIDEAESGRECLNMVKKQKYDLIYLDHMMPEMDGIETFRQLKNLQDNLSAAAPIIMLTANAVAGAKEEYLQLGFDDFLSKPIDPVKLEKMTHQYISA